MLGPNANLPWGGIRLTHHRRGPKFFYDASREIKKKADAERKAEPINQNGTSGKPDEENTAQRPNSKPGARKYNQVSQTQGQGWTLVEILTFVCKGHKKYHLVDLALLITTLAKTTPDNYPKIFSELGERYSKEGKDYGITGSRWKRLWERYRDTLDKCVSELRRGDKSLDGILSNKSKRNDTDSPLPPAASDTESETKFESPETGGEVRGAHTDPTLQRPPTSDGSSSGGSTGGDDFSRLEK